MISLGGNVLTIRKADHCSYTHWYPETIFRNRYVSLGTLNVLAIYKNVVSHFACFSAEFVIAD